MRRTLDDWNYRDGHMNNGMGWFIAFLVLALVIAAVVALVVAITRNSASARPDQTPAARTRPEPSWTSGLLVATSLSMSTGSVELHLMTSP